MTDPGETMAVNSELWHACAGPLVTLPQSGDLVYYFPQGHSEQVASIRRISPNFHPPNYSNVPSQILCQMNSVTLHADKDTDEIYAQMSLQPILSENDGMHIRSLGYYRSKHPVLYFCKTLTVSDTNTHGGFSVPRRAAEKIFPQLDYSMKPPNQELLIRDLHENVWLFRHIHRGQPKRHLLTTGWSIFLGAKQLKAGDAVLFIRDENSQLLLGVRRANENQTSLPSSVVPTDYVHICLIAAAAHAAASLSPFTVSYNPRATRSAFVVPLEKYRKANFAQVSVGMRFEMMFETAASTKQRCAGRVAGIGDCDPLQWPQSKWKNIQVEWDEHSHREKPARVSLWELDTVENSSCLTPLPLNLRRQCLPRNSVLEIGNPRVKSENIIMHVNCGEGSEYNQIGSYKSAYSSLVENFTDNHIQKSCPAGSVSLNDSTYSEAHPDHSFYAKGVERSSISDISLQTSDLCSDRFEMHDEQNQEAQLELLGNRHVEQESFSTCLYDEQLGNCLTSQGWLKNADYEDWMISSSQLQDFKGIVDAAENTFLSAKEKNVLWPAGDIPCSVDAENFDYRDIYQLPCHLDCFSDSIQEFAGSTEQQHAQGFVLQSRLNGASITMASDSCCKMTIPAAKITYSASLGCISTEVVQSMNIGQQHIGPSSTVDQLSTLCDLTHSAQRASSASTDGIGYQVHQKLMQPHLRSFTKVKKSGSIGRSIDVSLFKSYQELRAAIAVMFGLEGRLDDPAVSEWKLVYVDYENDVLLMGDDPWEEFVRCVRCIKIISPSETENVSSEPEWHASIE